MQRVAGHHLLGVVQDFFPEAMEYGRGYLLRYGGRRVGAQTEATRAIQEVLTYLQGGL